MAPSPARPPTPPEPPTASRPASSRHQDSPSTPDTHRTPILAAPPLLERLEAVDREADLRKFAFYGRQNAHVDHIVEAPREQDDDTLQSAQTLVEDGKLKARLDDVAYLLDALLGPVRTQAQAKAALELTGILQDHKIQQALTLAHRTMQSRVKLVLMKVDVEAPEKYRLALAVLAYFISMSGEMEEYFDDKVVDAIVNALKRENKRPSGAAGEKKKSGLAVEQLKKCLKRKRVDRGVMDAVDVFDFDGADEESAVKASGMADGAWQTQLTTLLEGQDMFFVEGKLHASVTDVLWATLLNLLMVDSSASCSPADENAVQPRLHQSQDERAGDIAKDNFQLICARKRQLVRNGGVNTLVRDLAKEIDILKPFLPTSLASPAPRRCAQSLHHLNVLLSVLDQVSFLAADVQRYLSRQRVLFSLVLKLIVLMSDLSLGEQAQDGWEAGSGCLMLAVEVLVTSLRVLINLTHHNADAARHMHALDGMKTLAVSFFRLRSLVDSFAALKIRPPAFDKWEFDTTLLLLSAMVNSVELSPWNRDALAAVQVAIQTESSTAAASYGERPASDACGMLTQFFLAKVESYAHLMSSQTQTSSEVVSIEENSDEWNPEDVILGGCTSILLGYLMEDSINCRNSILGCLPDRSPRILVSALSVFVAFHSQIGALTPEVVKSAVHIEAVLKALLRANSTDHSNLLASSAEDSSQQMEEVADTNFEQEMATVTASSDKNMDKIPRCPAASSRREPLRNVCSNIDDSDSEPNDSSKRASKGEETTVPKGMSTPTRSPLRNRRSTFAKATMRTPSPMRSRSRQSMTTAIQPDGTLSSPVVARLLRRTRQLVEEFDAEFACRSRSRAGVNSGVAVEGEMARSSGDSSPSVVLTMDVTCRDNGSNGLELSQDSPREDFDAGTPNHLPFKRTKKTKHEIAASAKPKHDLSVFEFEDTAPSTPLRKSKTNILSQTPTRVTNSPGESQVVTPKRKQLIKANGSSSQLQTPTRNGPSPIMNHSPASASPHRRKWKATRRLPSARASAVFDFTD